MKFKIIFVLIIAFTFTMCKKDHMLDCFKSSGNTTTENRTTASFFNINLKDNVDLIIHPNSAPYIKVTAGENLIGGIITELENNTLYIRNENRCNWMRSFENKFTVEVGMDKPVSIEYDGSGNISCIDTIRSTEFSFECRNGSGSMDFLFNCNKIHLNNHIGRSDIHAHGLATESYIYINDVGTIDASALVSNKCYIRSSTTGECRINVRDELGYEIKYNGDIYYTGDPQIYSNQVTGSGKLIKF